MVELAVKEKVGLAVVGKRLPKVDAVEKLMGKAVYGTDIELPGMLYGKILRSPHPHARIVRIDTSRAQKLPGVKAVVTAEDTPKTRYSISRRPSGVKDEQVLAFDKVRYIGDEVAGVAAIDEDIAEEALGLIKVEYELLPAVFEPEDAIKEDAPRVFGDSNVAKHVHATRGDVDRGFREADYVFEDRFRTQHVHQCHLEQTDCVASWDVSGKVTIWITSMDAYTVRFILARALGIKESDVRVIQPVVGGAFGAKLTLFRPYAICALLAKKAGRPVRVVNSREEDFSTTRPRLPMIIDIKTGVKKDGTLTAREIRAMADVGAYAGAGLGIMAVGMSYPIGLYKCPNIRIEGRTVYTNKLSMGEFRGYGGPQMLMACETQMDMIAEKIGVDPVDLRLKNVVDKGVNVLGWDIKSCGIRECIQKVAEYSNWYQKRKEKKPNRGLGLACTIFISDCKVFEFNGSTAHVKVDENAKISVRSGEIDYGQGAFTVFCQIAAEELGSSLEDVTFFGTDTDITPVGLGPWGDRVTVSGGNAVRLAAIDARRQLLEIASDMLKAEPEDLELRERKVFVKDNPSRHVSIEDVAHAVVYEKLGSPIIGTGTDVRKGVDSIDVTGDFAGNISSSYTFNAQVVEVEVDPLTGQVRVLHVTTANDLGKAINPMLAEGQAESQIVQGMGFGMLEGLKFDEGKVMNPSFMEYRIPNSADCPPIKVFLVETNDPNGPYGAKGAGEPTIIPTAAALANAIYDAVGVRMKDLPITPEKILRAIEAKSKR